MLLTSWDAVILCGVKRDPCVLDKQVAPLMFCKENRESLTCVYTDFFPVKMGHTVKPNFFFSEKNLNLPHRKAWSVFHESQKRQSCYEIFLRQILLAAPAFRNSVGLLPLAWDSGHYPGRQTTALNFCLVPQPPGLENSEHLGSMLLSFCLFAALHQCLSVCLSQRLFLMSSFLVVTVQRYLWLQSLYLIQFSSITTNSSPIRPNQSWKKIFRKKGLNLNETQTTFCYYNILWMY